VSDSNEEKSGFALRWKAIEQKKKIFDCNFDHGICDGWKMDLADFQWNVGIGPQEGDITGPKQHGKFIQKTP